MIHSRTVKAFAPVRSLQLRLPCVIRCCSHSCLQPARATRSSCSPPRRSLVVRAEVEGSEKEAATKEEESLPPWIRNERERKLQAEEGSDLPFPVYLIGSSLVAIAAVGSIFEFANRNAIFGVIKPDSFLWAPILLFFAITGFPSAAYLFLKAINAANKDSERQDKLDGY